VTSRRIEIDRDVLLDGQGNLTLDEKYDHLVVSVLPGVTAELRGFGVTRGWAGFGNAGGSGGGIYNSHGGTLVIRDSVVSGNTAEVAGGGINNRGSLTIARSTVSNNSANDEGGGILSEQFGPPDFLIASLTMIGNTVSDNGAATGAAVYLAHPDATVLRNLVEGDCANDRSALGSSGYNIESPGDTCGFRQATDQVGVRADDLKLGPLQDNGGPTETHALDAGSIGVDVIPEEDCLDADGEPLTTDQRGEPRPVGGMCDVGAFEAQL
jgi:hypothetical protein